MHRGLVDPGGSDQAGYPRHHGAGRWCVFSHQSTAKTVRLLSVGTGHGARRWYFKHAKHHKLRRVREGPGRDQENSAGLNKLSPAAVLLVFFLLSIVCS